VTELGRNVSLDVGIDKLPSARVHLLELEVLVGAGRDRLKPRVSVAMTSERRSVLTRSITRQRKSEIAKVG